GEVFSLDRGLLMGAMICNLARFQIPFEYHMFLKISKVVIRSSNYRSTRMLYTLEITSCLQITIS
ncbi:hypothetical protein N9219_04475, partial [bacterium]|nr:hypothetical protein [bacterium]